MLLVTMQSHDCCQIVRMVVQPKLTICSGWDPYETALKDWRFPKGYLHRTETNLKKSNEADTFLTLENGRGNHFTEINYLCLF